MRKTMMMEDSRGTNITVKRMTETRKTVERQSRKN
jgi:hypothetical protein